MKNSIGVCCRQNVTGCRKGQGSNAVSLTTKLGTIVYLAPVFLPAVGGGVVYLELLSNKLISSGACDNFIIVTESFPGSAKEELSNGRRLRIIRGYPYRAGRDVKTLSSYFSYFWQNLQFFTLPALTMRLSADILMVHGSFLNNPSSLWIVLRRIRRLSPKIKIVADLRDPKLPLHKVSSLKFFDLIISCSENVSMRLISNNDVFTKVREIPIIVDVAAPSKDVQNYTKSRYGLCSQRYVFNGSGMSQGKGSERLFDLVTAIRQKGHDIKLVIVGKRRYWSARFEKASQEGWFHYLGQVSHEEALALAAGSWLDVNLSVVDSMPRHSLEALLAGARVLLPRGIPEFERECADYIASEESIDELASKAIKITQGGGQDCKYNAERHKPENVIKDYVTALCEIV